MAKINITVTLSAELKQELDHLHGRFDALERQLGKGEGYQAETRTHTVKSMLPHVLRKDHEQVAMFTPTDNLIVAKGGEWIGGVIDKAFERLKRPGTPYAYFFHNGVIVTIDQKSTKESAREEWQKRLSALCDAVTSS